MKESPQDRMSMLLYILQLIGDLTSPEPDLHTVNRDSLSMTLGWLQQEMQSVMEEMQA